MHCQTLPSDVFNLHFTSAPTYSSQSYRFTGQAMRLRPEERQSLDSNARLKPGMGVADMMLIAYGNTGVISVTFVVGLDESDSKRAVTEGRVIPTPWPSWLAGADFCPSGFAMQKG
ncbi:uncharacterized protein BO72DRAFT_498317 [Aspergillus fijiensis CBS 313.89]|uniref:Uncharacterized protein n=1 Tax=Aspergillus fijiensis CBS 313.89 TaxID=1448319 RepID=A0A8G1RPI6_9EURO|nr:uncharacterized protein BO72DRAFT_498317 [Aspergillus fijiensis CBS 313.89]RAK75176.1 hypothetical protein BO72DRAFT_498317 [Aspergillus fijiensis CBS 313.89]